MTPFLTYAEQHAVGVILVACALASILLLVVSCCVLSSRDYPEQPRDVDAADRAARDAGFVEDREVQR